MAYMLIGLAFLLFAIGTVLAVRLGTRNEIVARLERYAENGTLVAMSAHQTYDQSNVRQRSLHFELAKGGIHIVSDADAQKGCRGIPGCAELGAYTFTQVARAGKRIYNRAGDNYRQAEDAHECLGVNSDVVWHWRHTAVWPVEFIELAI